MDREGEGAKKKRIVRRQRDAFDKNGDSTLGHSLVIDLNADTRALSWFQGSGEAGFSLGQIKVAKYYNIL